MITRGEEDIFISLFPSKTRHRELTKYETFETKKMLHFRTKTYQIGRFFGRSALSLNICKTGDSIIVSFHAGVKISPLF